MSDRRDSAKRRERRGQSTGNSSMRSHTKHVRIRGDVEGLGAVIEALRYRRFDLNSLSSAEWLQMSRRQRADHHLGPRYGGSPPLRRAVRQAHEMYVAMTPAQRRAVLHPDISIGGSMSAGPSRSWPAIWKGRDRLQTTCCHRAPGVPTRGPSPSGL